MTRSQRQRLVRGSSLAALLCTLNAGCLSHHESGQGSDTATNWLRVCSKQPDCAGGLSCIEHVCTRACASRAADACGELHPQASCQESADGSAARCALSCGSDRVCADFRAGYACVDGQCRPVEQAETLASGEPSQKDSLTTGTVALLPAEGPLLLSDRDRMARSPVVEARGEGWRVAWSTDAYGWEEPYPEVRGPATKPVEPRIEVADIAADASVSTRGMVHETIGGGGPTLVQGPGQIAYVQTVGTPGGLCQLRIIATAGPELLDAFDFECGGAIGVAAVPESEDWLVSYSDGGRTPGLELGRYRAGRGDWTAGAWDVRTVVGGMLSFAVVAGDAWFASTAGDGATYLRVPGIAAPLPADPDLPLPAPIAALQPAQHQVFTETPGGALVFYGNGLSLQSLLLEGITATESSVAPSRTASGASGWKKMGALRVPERGRTFVCYQGAFGASDKVAIVAVDDRGRRISEPIAISDEGVYMVNCALAWSGDALLATWNDLRVPRSGVSTYSTVSARILSLP